jgi:hypothetical protein
MGQFVLALDLYHTPASFTRVTGLATLQIDRIDLGQKGPMGNITVIRPRTIRQRTAFRRAQSFGINLGLRGLVAAAGFH